MSEPSWKIIGKAADGVTDVVSRVWPSGVSESCLITAIQKDLSEGAELQDADGNTMTAEQVAEFVNTLP